MSEVIQPWPLTRKDEPSVFGNRIEVTPTFFKNPKTDEEQLFPIVTIPGGRHGSFVIPVTEGGMVVTILEWMQALGEALQFVPFGVASYAGESPEITARRELLEEAGYEPGRLISLGDPFIIDPRHIKIWCYPFLALDCRLKKQKLDKGEIIETKLIPLEDWLRLVMSPHFPESAVAAGTFRALPFLDKDVVSRVIFG